MVFDKVRFIVEEMVEYDNHKIYFGSCDNSIVKKWYYLNEHNELYEMKEFKGGEKSRIKSFLVPAYPPLAGKHFYKKKMNNLRIEKRVLISALIKRTL